MIEREEDNHLDEGGQEPVVELDKGHPGLAHTDEVVRKVFIKTRFIKRAKAKALGLSVSGSESEDSVSGLWREMPRAAKEHAASLDDGALGSDGSPDADDPEFDG